MVIFQLILFCLFIVLIFVFLYDLVKAFRQSDDKKISLKTASKYIFTALLIVIIPILILKYFGTEPILKTTEQKIAFYTKHEYFMNLNKLYEGLTVKDKENYKLHFEYIDAIEKYINKNNDNDKFDFEGYKNSENHIRIQNFYKNKFKNNDKFKNMSNLFLALYSVNIKEIEERKDSISKLPEAEVYLAQIKNTEVPYYSYTKGKILSRTNSYKNLDEAENFLLQAKNETLGKSAATKELLRLYYMYNQRDKLKSFVYNDKIVGEMPSSIFKRIVYFRNFDLKNYWNTILEYKKTDFTLFGFFSALFILIIWLRYIRKLDVFEPEPWLHTLIVLSLSMITIELVYPYGDFLRDVFGYFPSQNPVKALVHDIIKIGVIEEFVKFIPFLIILKFSRAVNEPYDYIYYMSVSALGFAFVENLGYIQNGSLYNIAVRGIMPAVAHMLFSATIGYGLMLAKYKNKNPYLMFILFFVLASIMHGFYDYWLINKIVADYEWASILFFILMVHFWHIYVNNALNISTFYNKKIKIESDTIRYEILLSLLMLLMLSYLFYGLALGKEKALEQLIFTALIFGYLIMYLSYSMSRFAIIRGYFKPFTLPISLFIPRLKKRTSNTGVGIKLTPSKHKSLKEFEHIKQLLPLYGILERRLVFGYDLECYLMVLENPLNIEAYYCDAVAITPKSLNKTLDNDDKILASILLIKSKDVLDKIFLEEKDLVFVGYAISKKIGKV